MHGYDEFTDALVRGLESDVRVLGLVALGSMARQGRLPDRWSDHDFFVIAEEAEAFRETSAWLPWPEEIAVWFRDTPHGCKAIYDEGRLLDYAVFTPQELSLARVNAYRVLLDRGGIEERMAELAQASLTAAPDVERARGLFLSNLLVAYGRARRGELFSARSILAEAMRQLVVVLGGGPDDLDPLRRFEHYGIEQAMRLGPAAACGALLDVCEAEAGADPRAISALRAVIE